MTSDELTPGGESETLLARPTLPPGPPPATATPARGSLLERARRSRRAPIVRLALYYLALAAVGWALVEYVPAVRDAFVAPVILPGVHGGGGLLSADGGVATAADITDPLARGTTTLIVILGALALVVPVAWVYMFTKRFRFDPALVSSVIILPIVVAGISLVVKNSLALAFSLAGIVAAVRFRNTLKDPRDAVYIFLVIGIGLSAGVQALDVALVMSMAFNVVVLVLWKYNVGSIYGGRYGRTGIPSVGDPALMAAQDPDAQRRIRLSMVERDEDVRTDGILLVHSYEPERARETVAEALGDMARDWRLVDAVGRGEGLATLEYLVRLKRSATPPELVGALDERWSSQVAAAEYVPFRTRRRKRKARKRGEDADRGRTDGGGEGADERAARSARAEKRDAKGDGGKGGKGRAAASADGR